jgi:hypothetical protein
MIKVPSAVKAAGIAKWEEGVRMAEAGEYDFGQWWAHTGLIKCAFCEMYTCNFEMAGITKPLCPLCDDADYLDCMSEWCELNDMIIISKTLIEGEKVIVETAPFNIGRALVLARAILERIRALPEEDE